MLKRWIATLILGVVLFISVSMGQETGDRFAMANNFYEEKDYESAIRLYQAVLSEGKESAALYYNLGNACFKNGDLGHAVLYYLRAKRLAPADEDLTHNLEFARQFSRVRMEGVALNPVSGFLQNLVDPYRLDTMAWVSSFVFVLFCLLLIIRFGLGITNAIVKPSLLTLLVLLLATSGLTTFKYRTEYLTQRAVLITDDSPVLSGPTEKADTEFQGSSGLVVEILSESGDYYNVLFENKRRGWINKENAAII